MTTHERTTLIQQLLEAYNRQDGAAAIACYHSDATNHGRPVGRAGLARVFANLYAVFPDFRFESTLLLLDGEWVTSQMTMRGTHRGMPDLTVFGGLLNGVPPTGKVVSVQNIHLYTVVDGLIADYHAVGDGLGMLQQIGLLPAPSHLARDISRPPMRDPGTPAE